MLNTPFSPWPSFSEAEAQAVADVIRSNRVNYWTGDECRAFEREYASWAGSRHAIALSNGTLALDVALVALGIGPGDEVIVSPRTFIASVSCVVNIGATPVFADVDRESGTISAATIEPLITPRTRAIIPVHIGGWPSDMPAIMDLARRHDLRVIEDCAQAHGARCGDRMVGTFGEVGAWSFCQDKIITTAGEGGMVTTDDPGLWSRMWSYKDHGKSWSAVYERQHPPGYRWVHESFGTNWRMLEVQAAVGRIQLRILEEWTTRRTANALQIASACGRHAALRAPLPADGFTHAFYRMYAYVRPEALAAGWSRDRIVAAMNEGGVPVYQGTASEVYLEKAFADAGLQPAGRLPVARELGETSIMFLVHPTLTDAEIERTCSVLSATMTAATR